MAELEAEVFLIGKWKSFEELEDNISLVELDLIIKHKRQSENDNRKFAAAIAGIDLDKDSNSAVEKKLAEVRRRAQAKLAGGEKELEKMEWADLGFGYESV